MTDIFKAHLSPLSTGTLILLLSDLHLAIDTLRESEIRERGGPFEYGIPRGPLMAEIERMSHYLAPCEHTAPEEDEIAGEVEEDRSDMSLLFQKAQDIPPFLMVNSLQEAGLIVAAMDKEERMWRESNAHIPSDQAADQSAVAHDLAERARCAVREWSARVMAQEAALPTLASLRGIMKREGDGPDE